MIFDLDLWPTDLTINRDHLLIKDYLPTEFEASGAKRYWVIRCTSYQLHKVFDLDLWPTDLTINRDNLLTKDYLPTKFEASRAKRSGVISCTRLRATDIPTDRPTCATQYAPPSSKGGAYQLFALIIALTKKFRVGAKHKGQSADRKHKYLIFCLRETEMIQTGNRTNGDANTGWLGHKNLRFQLSLLKVRSVGTR